MFYGGEGSPMKRRDAWYARRRISLGIHIPSEKVKKETQLCRFGGSSRTFSEGTTGSQGHVAHIK